jgi:hypothetical protein
MKAVWNHLFTRFVLRIEKKTDTCMGKVQTLSSVKSGGTHNNVKTRGTHSNVKTYGTRNNVRTGGTHSNIKTGGTQ